MRFSFDCAAVRYNCFNFTEEHNHLRAIDGHRWRIAADPDDPLAVQILLVYLTLPISHHINVQQVRTLCEGLFTQKNPRTTQKKSEKNPKNPRFFFFFKI